MIRMFSIIPSRPVLGWFLHTHTHAERFAVGSWSPSLRFGVQLREIYIHTECSRVDIFTIRKFDSLFAMVLVSMYIHYSVCLLWHLSPRRNKHAAHTHLHTISLTIEINNHLLLFLYLLDGYQSTRVCEMMKIIEL